jgi:hypothetical protein
MKIRLKASTQVWKVVGVILLVCGLQLYGQQTASGAEAEAKAATYTTFYPTGSATDTVYIQPMAINPAEQSRDTTLTEAPFRAPRLPAGPQRFLDYHHRLPGGLLPNLTNVLYRLFLRRDSATSC